MAGSPLRKLADRDLFESMNPAAVLGIGLLILIANLTLCAVLSSGPSLMGGDPRGRLRSTWRALFLAVVQVAVWAAMFHEGGVCATPEAAFEEALRLFTFMGRNPGGLEGEWASLAMFVSLNGLLFLPAVLLSGSQSEVRVIATTGLDFPKQLEEKHLYPKEKVLLSSPQPAQTGQPCSETEFQKGEAFRGPLPKLEKREKPELELPELPVFTPERTPPTPPPIRFQ